MIYKLLFYLLTVAASVLYLVQKNAKYKNDNKDVDKLDKESLKKESEIILEADNITE
jgi:hypothetical protein